MPFALCMTKIGDLKSLTKSIIFLQTGIPKSKLCINYLKASIKPNPNKQTKPNLTNQPKKKSHQNTTQPTNHQTTVTLTNLHLCLVRFFNFSWYSFQTNITQVLKIPMLYNKQNPSNSVCINHA